MKKEKKREGEDRVVEIRAASNLTVVTCCSLLTLSTVFLFSTYFTVLYLSAIVYFLIYFVLL